MEEFLESGFPIMMVWIFIMVVIIASVFTAKKKQQQADHEARVKASKAAPKKAAAPVKKAPPARKPARSMFDVDEHGHSHGSGSDSVETKEDIVGSLGANYDEGCPDLANIRIVTGTDEHGEDEHDFDYDRIVSAIVFGSALSEPKWKN